MDILRDGIDLEAYGLKLNCHGRNRILRADAVDSVDDREHIACRSQKGVERQRGKAAQRQVYHVARDADICRDAALQVVVLVNTRRQQGKAR